MDSIIFINIIAVYGYHNASNRVILFPVQGQYVSVLNDVTHQQHWAGVDSQYLYSKLIACTQRIPEKSRCTCKLIESIVSP